MSEPAFNFSGLDSVSDAASQVVEKAAERAQVIAYKAAEQADSAMRAAQRVRDRLYVRWERMNAQIEQASHRIPEFKQELYDDAGYIADRARYYHETRPLSALGTVAAAAFVLGIVIGFGRR
jgi:ElaB/YqjD/DUF883 family membrane-anchored ribosome-binding protein